MIAHLFEVSNSKQRLLLTDSPADEHGLTMEQPIARRLLGKHRRRDK